MLLWRTAVDPHTIETAISAVLELLMAISYGLVLMRVKRPSHEALHSFLIALYLAGFGTKVSLLLLGSTHLLT
jgi:hypothetical protein